jgi:hypothetical protein
MGWELRVAHTGFGEKKLKNRTKVEDLKKDGRIILKWM